MQILKRTGLFVIGGCLSLGLFAQNDPFGQDPAQVNRGLKITGICLDAASGITVLSSLALNAAQVGGGAQLETGYSGETNRQATPFGSLVGTLSIIYGSALVAAYHSVDKNDAIMTPQIYRIGISNIALGVADILLPPLLNLAFSGLGGKVKGDKKAPVSLGLYMPPAINGNFVMGLSVRKTF